MIWLPLERNPYFSWNRLAIFELNFHRYLFAISELVNQRSKRDRTISDLVIEAEFIPIKGLQSKRLIFKCIDLVEMKVTSPVHTQGERLRSGRNMLAALNEIAFVPIAQLTSQTKG